MGHIGGHLRTACITREDVELVEGGGLDAPATA
jgi:hypothetical protein